MEQLPGEDWEMYVDPRIEMFGERPQLTREQFIQLTDKMIDDGDEEAATELIRAYEDGEELPYEVK